MFSAKLFVNMLDVLTYKIRHITPQNIFENVFVWHMFNIRPIVVLIAQNAVAEPPTTYESSAIIGGAGVVGCLLLIAVLIAIIGATQQRRRRRRYGHTAYSRQLFRSYCIYSVSQKSIHLRFSDIFPQTVVKFGLKIPNRLGKNVRKPQGGTCFDSHCMFKFWLKLPAPLWTFSSFERTVRSQLGASDRKRTNACWQSIIQWESRTFGTPLLVRSVRGLAISE